MFLVRPFPLSEGDFLSPSDAVRREGIIMLELLTTIFALINTIINVAKFILDNKKNK